MSVTLNKAELRDTVDRAYVFASGNEQLPKFWSDRFSELRDTTSKGLIAALGAALLAKATNPEVDVRVMQAGAGVQGAFSLRGPAGVLAEKASQLGFDIGSKSIRDPINQKLFLNSRRWDDALKHVRHDHRPQFEIVYSWIVELHAATQEEAFVALSSYIRERIRVVANHAGVDIPAELEQAPKLADLISVIDSFVETRPEGGATGEALVAAAFKCAGFDVKLLSANDPRRLDVVVESDGIAVIGCEVKQLNVGEAVANRLVIDTAEAKMRRAVLAVLPPGSLERFDTEGAIVRAEERHGVVLRVTVGTRSIIHEAISSGNVTVGDFCRQLPNVFGHFLLHMEVREEAIKWWVTLSSRWSSD